MTMPASLNQSPPTALEKAKAALEAAKEMDVDLAADTLPRKYVRLLDLASVQANVAQAEALQALAPREWYGGPR